MFLRKSVFSLVLALFLFSGVVSAVTYIDSCQTLGIEGEE